MSITTLSAVKAVMAIDPSNTSKDGKLIPLLPVADDVLRDYCHQNLERASYTEYISGKNREKILLRQKPILDPADVTEVWIDQTGYGGQGINAFTNTTGQQIQGQDYMVDTDICGLVRLLSPILDFASYGDGTLFGGPRGPRWPLGTKNIRVKYSAGYKVAPTRLITAGALLVSLMFRTGPVGPGGAFVTSESVGSYSYSLQVASPGEAPELGTVRQLLSRFRDQTV